jgi:hypothetical protein
VGRRACQVAIACALIGLGWAAGRAQGTVPDFVLSVTAPAGETVIRCVRGCTLAWVERGVNPNATPQASFSFNCRGAGVETCFSGGVGGWVKP